MKSKPLAWSIELAGLGLYLPARLPHTLTLLSMPEAWQPTRSFLNLPIPSLMWFFAAADLSARKVLPLDLHMVIPFHSSGLCLQGPFWRSLSRPVSPSLPNSRSHPPTYWDPCSTYPTLKSSCFPIDWLSPPSKCKDEMFGPHEDGDLASPSAQTAPWHRMVPTNYLNGWMNRSYNAKGLFQLQTLPPRPRMVQVAPVMGNAPSPPLRYRSGVNYNHPNRLLSMIKPEHPHKSSFQTNTATNVLVARNPWAVNLNF